jgi:CubicO group peptidase (beta-lactamase class C family)
MFGSRQDRIRRSTPPQATRLRRGIWPPNAIRVAAIALAAAVLAGTAAAARQNPRPQPVLPAPVFEYYLEALRQQAGIPGMSAAVVQDGQIVWERGFGFQNVEARIAATPDTPYLVGSVAQSMAAVVLLRCVEQRQLLLDAPIREYGLALPEADATVRQVLSHSSAAGVSYRYAPERYVLLNGIADRCAEQPYRKAVAEGILERLAMLDSVPGADLRNRTVVPPQMFDVEDHERYERILDRLAIPYRVGRRNRPVRVETMPLDIMSPTGGLVTTVRDFARFDAALDTDLLLLAETRGAMWTRGFGRDGTLLPTGLGWFVQSYQGEPVVWQFGMNDGYSSLVIKLPQRRLTFILFANSDRLSSPFDLASGNVAPSLFATLFLRLFM